MSGAINEALIRVDPNSMPRMALPVSISVVLCLSSPIQIPRRLLVTAAALHGVGASLLSVVRIFSVLPLEVFAD